MQQRTVNLVLAKYGHELAQLYPCQRGYRNESNPVRLRTGQMANVILYKHEPTILTTINHIHTVSNYLAGQGLPVRAPLDPRVMRLRSSQQARYLALYNYLSGHTIPWEAYTRKHLKLLGKTMGDMHAALRQCSVHTLPNASDVCKATLVRMDNYFNAPQVLQAMEGKLGIVVPAQQIGRMARLLSMCAELPDRHILHMDFVRSNVLFDAAYNEFGIAVSGILDFEKVAIGHPIFDIARTLAFLFVDCKYKPEAKIRKYFLVSGYKKRGAGQALPQQRLSEGLINFFLLHDLYKFLRHNPYEDLGQNEHFIRTRDILLRHGVISTTPIV